MRVFVLVEELEQLVGHAAVLADGVGGDALHCEVQQRCTFVHGVHVVQQALHGRDDGAVQLDLVERRLLQLVWLALVRLRPARQHEVRLQLNQRCPRRNVHTHNHKPAQLRFSLDISFFLSYHVLPSRYSPQYV